MAAYPSPASARARSPSRSPRLGQQLGQPPGGGLVAGVGGMAVERDGVAVQQPVPGAVREPGGVGGVADMAEEGVPGAGGHAGGAAFPGGVLEQVVRRGVPGDLAHASPGGAQGGGGAVQFLGGVGQGLLEPVGRRLGLLRAGAVARRGGAQQVSAERGAGAEPGRVQRRGQHRPPVRAGGLGVLPPGDQLRRGRQRLGQPVPARLQRGPQLRIPGRGGAGPVLLGRAELRGDANDVGQVQHFAFPRVRIGAAGGAARRCRWLYRSGHSVPMITTGPGAPSSARTTPPVSPCSPSR